MVAVWTGLLSLFVLIPKTLKQRSKRCDSNSSRYKDSMFSLSDFWWRFPIRSINVNLKCSVGNRSVLFTWWFWEFHHILDSKMDYGTVKLKQLQSTHSCFSKPLLDDFIVPINICIGRTNKVYFIQFEETYLCHKKPSCISSWKFLK